MKIVQTRCPRMTLRELFALMDEETAFEMWKADWEWEMLRNAALEELRNAGVGTMWGPVEELEWQALREEDERILVALRNGPPGVLWEQSGNEVAGGRARACGAAVAAAPGGWPRGQVRARDAEEKAGQKRTIRRTPSGTIL